MTGQVEHDFVLFSNEEIDRGIQYAAENDRVTLDRNRLRVIANNAGKTRKVLRIAPRIAASRAMQAYHNEYPAVTFSSPYFEGYVHAVAKMLSWRSKRVREKRERDEAVAELKAASHGIEKSKPLDPEIQLELFELTRSKADT